MMHLLDSPNSYVRSKVKNKIDRHIVPVLKPFRTKVRSAHPIIRHIYRSKTNVELSLDQSASYFAFFVCENRLSPKKVRIFEFIRSTHNEWIPGNL